MAKVRFSVRSPKKQPPRRRRRQLLIQRLHWEGYGGARRDRTDDLLLAKQALSQLSYGPIRFAGCTFVPGKGKPAVKAGARSVICEWASPVNPFFGFGAARSAGNE